MPEPRDPRSSYTGRRDRFEARRADVARRSTWLSAARLSAFLLALVLGIAAELRSARALAIAAFACVVAFVALIVLHGAIRRREAWLTALRDLNDEGLRRLDRDWAALPARGGPAADPYGVAADLDLFGSPGLIQLLGPVGTPRGRATLEAWLMEGAVPVEVAARQAAVRELADAHDLRDTLAAHGRAAGAVRHGDIDAFLAWAEGPPEVRAGALLTTLAFVLPVATIALMAAGAAGTVPGSFWALPVLVAIALTAGPGRAVRRSFRRAFGREGMFRGYPEMFDVVARMQPSSERLARIHDSLGADHVHAATLMKRLARLMHLADLRHSGTTWAIAQFLLLWDFHVHRAVETWRRRAGGHAREWLALLGELEALSALGTLAHDHPEWAFADVTDDGPALLEAEALGHPLLPTDVRVDNDVAVGPPGTFLFITGSNMSGKSTLLRAIGVNVTLALAGGPACARRLRVPPVELRTGIHVHDSVVQGVSFFMAQLRRLKEVVTAAEAGASDGAPRVLYLLDEILAGTNSAERRVAATRVIRHLVEVGAIGAVTTHDLELGDQPELTPAARAVHFTEKVDGAADAVTMTFDYRLRPGVATSTNALRLMRAIGLDR